MGKTACKDKAFEGANDPKYVCKKCGAKVKKEKQEFRSPAFLLLFVDGFVRSVDFEF